MFTEIPKSVKYLLQTRNIFEWTNPYPDTMGSFSTRLEKARQNATRTLEGRSDATIIEIASGKGLVVVFTGNRANRDHTLTSTYHILADKNSAKLAGISSTIETIGHPLLLKARLALSGQVTNCWSIYGCDTAAYLLDEKDDAIAVFIRQINSGSTYGGRPTAIMANHAAQLILQPGQ